MPLDRPTYDTHDFVLLDELRRNPTVRRAAQELGLTRSTLSRRLAALETKLGEEVFLRRGKRLVPTQFGASLLEKASEVTRALEGFTITAADASAASKDRITLAAAPLFAELVLPDVLERFHAQRPGVRIELRLSHERAPLFEEQIDLALRRGPLADSDSLVARRLGRTTFVSVARAGMAWATPPVEARARRSRRASKRDDDASDPLTPPAPLVAWVKTLPWIKIAARLGPFEVSVAPDTRALVTPSYAVDSQKIALDLVRRGVGVARVNLFQVRQELGRGELVELLPESRATEDVYAVYPRQRRLRPALRDLLAEIVATAADLEIWDEQGD